MEERSEWEAEEGLENPSFEEDYPPEAEMFLQEEAATPLNIWQKIRRFFFTSAEEQLEKERQTLQELNAYIERYPQAAVNYLLRGELHLRQKQYDLALEDLQKALELAESAFERERWGLASQVIADKARRGLAELLRYS